MENTKTKTPGQLAVILILAAIVSLMLFSFGMDLGMDYYDLTHP